MILLAEKLLAVYMVVDLFGRYAIGVVFSCLICGHPTRPPLLFMPKPRRSTTAAMPWHRLDLCQTKPQPQPMTVLLCFDPSHQSPDIEAIITWYTEAWYTEAVASRGNRGSVGNISLLDILLHRRVLSSRHCLYSPLPNSHNRNNNRRCLPPAVVFNGLLCRCIAA